MAADAIDHAIQLLNNGLAIVGDNARPLRCSRPRPSPVSRSRHRPRRARTRRSGEVCGESLRARAERRSRIPAARLDRILRGLTQDAVRNLKKAVERDPNDVDTLLLLCNCYLISGKVPASRPLIARLLTLDPLTPVTRCLPGFADVSEGIFEEPSSRTGRCSRWIRTTRWRGCSTPGSWR